MRSVLHELWGQDYKLKAGLQRRGLLVALGSTMLCRAAAAQTNQETIERVKRSIVAVGTVHRTRAPQFLFRGTGFVVGDGTLVATSAHVLPENFGPGPGEESLAIVLAGATPTTQGRLATRLAIDAETDLALLRIPGPSLPGLELGDTTAVREGDSMLVTGFPLGTTLGTFPVSHRAMIAAIAPIAIPPPSARQLDSAKIRQLKAGAFPIFQLDATIHPGNSGSPLYEPVSGKVVGVVNMAFVRAMREGASLPSGISYAIPAHHLASLLAANTSGR